MKTVFLVSLSHDKNAIKRRDSSRVRYPIIFFHLYSVLQCLMFDGLMGWMLRGSQACAVSHGHLNTFTSEPWQTTHEHKCIAKSVKEWEYVRDLQLCYSYIKIGFIPHFLIMFMCCLFLQSHTVPTHGVSVTILALNTSPLHNTIMCWSHTLPAHTSVCDHMIWHKKALALFW